MPSFHHLLKWIEARPERGERYARAKQESAEFDADNVNYIAELCLRGKVDPASARVAIDAYKWSSGKKKPKKYGDRLDLTSKDEKIGNLFIDPFAKIRQNVGLDGKTNTSD